VALQGVAPTTLRSGYLPDHVSIDLADPSSWSGRSSMTSLPLPSQGRTRKHRHSLVLRPLAPALPVHQPIPNNFGPTVLLALGVLLVPLLIGVPFMVWGLARIRNAQGELALPWMSTRLPGFVGWWRDPS
jgi:hypothetical protein